MSLRAKVGWKRFMNKEITCELNEHGWLLLFRTLGSKIVLRTYKVKPKKIKRISDEENQHRMFEINVEGGLKARPKLGWNTTNF